MVIRSRRAAVDLSLLAQPGIAGGGSGVARLAARTIDLNLFADVNLVAQLDYVETVAALGDAWVGQVSGVEGSQVVLAVADGVLSGSIELPTHLYSVTQRDGSYVIAEVNRPVQPGDDAVSVPAEARANPAANAVAAAVDSGDVYDLLLYYTSGAKNEAGGTAAVSALITAAIARVNAAYVASGISTRVRLVAAIESGYVDTLSLSTDLTALRASADVRAARDRYGADIVTILVARGANYGGSSGIGYVSVSQGVAAADYGYNVTVYYSFLGYIYSLAHEIGHNQGSLHEPGNSTGGDTSGAYLYSLGYTDTVHKFYDAMSYGLGCTNCTQLNQFSSPVNTYQGFPTGTAGQDNVRSINNTRSMIANYRPTGGAVTPGAPSAFTTSAIGTSVTMTWQAPTTGDRPTTYYIASGAASGRSDLANFSTGSTATSFSADRVGLGTYYVRVRAANAAGIGSESNESILVVGASAPIAVPGAPTSFVTSAFGTTVTMTWRAPATGGTPTTYYIASGSSSGLSDLAYYSTGSTATSFSADRVGLGVYYVRVRAANAVGTGAESNESILVVGNGCASPPTAPGTLAGSSSGGTIFLLWGAAAGNPTSYVVEAGSGPSLSNLAISDLGSLTPSLAAPNVSRGLYYIRIRGKNGCGVGPASNEVTVIVP